MAAEDVEGDEALDIATQAYMDAVNIGGRKGLERTVRAIREYGKRQREKMAVLGVEVLSGEVAALQEKLRQAEEQVAQLDMLNSGKSPCGHWSAYAATNDGGKHIICLQCRAEKAEAALGAERAQTRDLDSKLQGMEKLAENFRVTLAAEREAHARLRERMGEK